MKTIITLAISHALIGAASFYLGENHIMQQWENALPAGKTQEQPANKTFNIEAKAGTTDHPVTDTAADVIITLPDANGWLVTEEEKKLLEEMVKERKAKP